jgi:hypothetical protein
MSMLDVIMYLTVAFKLATRTIRIMYTRKWHSLWMTTYIVPLTPSLTSRVVAAVSLTVGVTWSASVGSAPHSLRSLRAGRNPTPSPASSTPTPTPKYEYSYRFYCFCNSLRLSLDLLLKDFSAAVFLRDVIFYRYHNIIIQLLSAT